MGAFDEFKKKLESFCDWYNVKNDIEWVIFGAGNTAMLYQECFKVEGIEPKYFSDNDKNKHGKYILGKEIIAPEDIRKKCKDAKVLILSAVPEVCEEIKKQCVDLGVDARMFDEIVFYKRRQEILDNYLSLEDEKSRHIYENIIMARAEGKAIPEDCYSDNQYFAFPAFLKRRTSEVFVDCGAYVGDSVEEYIWKKAGVFKKIYAFEPDEVNYERMLKRITRLESEWGFETAKINSILAGVGEHTDAVFIEKRIENGSSISARVADCGNEKIDIYSLDDYFVNEKISFLKADIESYELRMLNGAKRILKEHKPVIAVCIYHNATDMYSIIQAIKNINNTYKFGIRHHAVEYCETVLYAW